MGMPMQMGGAMPMQGLPNPPNAAQHDDRERKRHRMEEI